MPFTESLASWPWLVGYVTVASVVFIWLRRCSSTDQQALKSLDQAHGFGASTTLGPISAAFFRLTCPRLLLLTLLIACALRLAVGRWNLWDAAVVLSVVAFWPVQEWLIHVFVLHWKPFSLLGRQIDPIISRNHRNHHRNPWDPALGITPPHIIWLYTSALPVVWSLALPIPQAITGVAAYFALALNYEWIHYLIHTSYVPRSWFYKRLWLNHRLHHFKNEQFWYGVTMLSGDWLLQTQPPAQQASRSETCLTLGVASEEGVPASVEGPALAGRKERSGTPPVGAAS